MILGTALVVLEESLINMVIDSIIKTKNDRLSYHQYMNDFFEPSLLDFSGFESDAEFIPLTTAEEEENVNKQISQLETDL